LESEYREIIELLDRGGLPWDRAMARLSFGKWLTNSGRMDDAQIVAKETSDLAERFAMPIIAADAQALTRQITAGTRDGAFCG
jgi:hypothetical protein